MLFVVFLYQYNLFYILGGAFMNKDQYYNAIEEFNLKYGDLLSQDEKISHLMCGVIEDSPIHPKNTFIAIAATNKGVLLVSNIVEIQSYRDLYPASIDTINGNNILTIGLPKYNLRITLPCDLTYSECTAFCEFVNSNINL